MTSAMHLPWAAGAFLEAFKVIAVPAGGGKIDGKAAPISKGPRAAGKILPWVHILPDAVSFG